jgi:hypothetical protein
MCLFGKSQSELVMSWLCVRDLYLSPVKCLKKQVLATYIQVTIGPHRV